MCPYVPGAQTVTEGTIIHSINASPVNLNLTSEEKLLYVSQAIVLCKWSTNSRKTRHRNKPGRFIIQGIWGQKPMYTSTLNTRGQASSETYTTVSKIPFSKSLTSSKQKDLQYIKYSNVSVNNPYSLCSNCCETSHFSLMDSEQQTQLFRSTGSLLRAVCSAQRL